MSRPKKTTEKNRADDGQFFISLNYFDVTFRPRKKNWIKDIGHDKLIKTPPEQFMALVDLTGCSAKNNPFIHSLRV